MTQPAHVPPGVDTSIPTPARIYDYMLKGHHYFDRDQQAAEQILAAVPEVRDAACPPWATPMMLCRSSFPT